jgi:hypothetical protein
MSSSGIGGGWNLQPCTALQQLKIATTIFRRSSDQQHRKTLTRCSASYFFTRMHFCAARLHAALMARQLRKYQIVVECIDSVSVQRQHPIFGSTKPGPLDNRLARKLFG